MKKLITWWKQHQTFKQTYRELSKLSTRELDDIGIHRGLISRLAYEESQKVK